MAFVNPICNTVFFGRHHSLACRRRPQFARFTMSASSDIPDVLAKILDRKKTEVAQLKAELDKDPDHPISKTLSNKGKINRKKEFQAALNLPQGSLTVIAEIKRRSPSKGAIGKIKDAAVLARVYHEGGAGAISVLTDLEGFGGTMNDLRRVVECQARHRGNFPGPCAVLRKDFIIDEVQIAEAAEAGASAILLIVAALGKERTSELLEAAHSMGMDALVEVHDEDELQIAVDVGAEIIGINNRDLRTFDVSLDTSFRLGPLVPDGIIKVAESGIEESTDAWKLRDAGFSAVLVGETLVKAYEQSASDSTSYVVGYNQAKGYIKAFKAKGSVQYGTGNVAAFYGKGEGAKESLGEISI